MSLRNIVIDDGSSQLKDILQKADGQILEVLPGLPHGYEYKLERVSNASNTKWLLTIVKSVQKCTLTQSHTREVCGNSSCRES